MNIGMIIIGVTAIGYIIPMDTIVYIMYGGILGGVIGIGGDAIGVITFPGIFSIAVSTSYGLKMADGGSDPDMVVGCATDVLIPTMS